MIDEQKILILRHLVETKNKIVVKNIPIFNGVSEDIHNAAINELKKSGYIEYNKAIAFRILPQGETYLTRHRLDELPKNEPSIHIGNKIDGNVYDSDLSIDMSLDKQITNNKTHAKKPTKSLFEWIVIIIGFIGSMVGIYWFLTK
jgi:hypothetical protein